jgi:hypothetical protein
MPRSQSAASSGNGSATVARHLNSVRKPQLSAVGFTGRSSARWSVANAASGWTIVKIADVLDIDAGELVSGLPLASGEPK